MTQFDFLIKDLYDNHLSEQGGDIGLETLLQQTTVSIEQHQSEYLKYKLVYEELAKKLLEKEIEQTHDNFGRSEDPNQNEKKQPSSSSSSSSSMLHEEFVCASVDNVLSIDPLAVQSEKSSAFNIFGLSCAELRQLTKQPPRQKIVTHSITEKTTSKQKLDKETKELVTDLEILFLKKIEDLEHFVTLTEELPTLRKWIKYHKKQHERNQREILKLERVIEITFWEHMTTLTHYLSLLQDTLEYHKFGSQPDFTKVSMNWLSSRFKIVLFKMKLLNYQFLFESLEETRPVQIDQTHTISVSPLKALAQIREALDEQLEMKKTENSQISKKIQQYQSLGEDYEKLVQTYAEVTKQLQSKAQAIEQLEK